jgi:hypothetical protein
MMVSCYKPYSTDISTDNRILVVNGLITDEVASYQVWLNYAVSFYSKNNYLPLNNAQVFVSDNTGNTYDFHELDDGRYISDSLKFTGETGKTYTLHISTSDGEMYESNAQRLFPAINPDSVYAEYDNKEILSQISGLKMLSHEAYILMDINNRTDTLSRFRYTSSLVRQYFYFYCLDVPPPIEPCYHFYCWQTDNANSDINLTGGSYLVNSSSVKKHPVCFLDDQLYFNASVYNIGDQEPGGSFRAIGTVAYQSYLIMMRILYINQYTLNGDAYSYYKSMNDQLLSEGKMFDPIATQLIGNIKCVTDPDKKTLGFFETSAVSHISCKVDFRNLTNEQPSITRIPLKIPPEPTGCYINKVPDFWVYL